MTPHDALRNDTRRNHGASHHASALSISMLPSVRNSCRERGLTLPALCRALDTIHGRLGEKVTLKDIADTACMSRFHFARLFRRSTGYSPMEYLLHARLEQAKSLLRQHAMPISDIAASMGFADQSHLTRHFRRAVGMTPLQYARRCEIAPAPLGCSPSL